MAQRRGMRIVIDTNLWVSGLLWRGLPWRLVQLAEQKIVELCLAPPMIAELVEVLAYPKLQPRLRQLEVTAAELVQYAIGLASIWEIPATNGEPIVKADPDDDIFPRCAVNAHAAYVVTGDGHLLNLGQYVGIPIVTVRDFFTREFPAMIEG